MLHRSAVSSWLQPCASRAARTLAASLACKARYVAPFRCGPAYLACPDAWTGARAPGHDLEVVIGSIHQEGASMRATSLVLRLIGVALFFSAERREVELWPRENPLE